MRMNGCQNTSNVPVSLDVSAVLQHVKTLYRALQGVRRIFTRTAGAFEIIWYRSTPKRKRAINHKSRKIVYIGHSYHQKTKSTGFLLDYLKEHYEVKEVLDESWRDAGEPFPDLSFIDESYLAVILFQSLPVREEITKIRNDNIIFFPMYDATANWAYGKWRECRNMRIMNFSSTLNARLLKWGFDSDVVQYFPKPLDFSPGARDEVFFWQRITDLSINTVLPLLGDEEIKIHMHKAVDPGQVYTPPTREMESKYKITYSKWFDTRAQMLDVIKEKGIYIAPRRNEGIGLSFLEAMAMGKAVVAANNPTMNEYIVNHKTGYLFDLARPRKIDFSNIVETQKNTYQFMLNGYERWQSDKRKIIDFVEGK